MPSDNQPQIFTSDFIDDLFSRFGARASEAGVTKDALADALTLSVNATLAQLGVFWPTTNPTQMYCNMPHNGHNFTNNGQAKHCSNSTCNFDYCDTHAISHCVNCGTQL